MAPLGGEESGHCREIKTRVNVWTVHGGLSGCSTVAIINNHFFFSFQAPLLWFPAAMDTITWVSKE